ncbi:outer dense fiber protein 3 [Nephila pilipes]|uniref:Outer dense fiber protein 3 n=1 Tax=Nephila pilipes TaxID=299642 RepID=A0A8X6P781_NEPPI|nr:outer dense fiber protein 3 [Nephila pilipes]
MATIDTQNDSEKKDKKKEEVKKYTEDKYPQPTNQDYLSYYVYQGEWKPTRPIGILGVQTSSPGPAIVNLPSTVGEENHDPTRSKAPGYKMGIKLPKEDLKTGPGPAKYYIEGLTNMGKETSKAPRLAKAARFSDKVGTVSPGPAAYNREEGDKCVFPKAPAYSMPHSQRSKIKGVVTPEEVYVIVWKSEGGGRHIMPKRDCHSIISKRFCFKRKCISLETELIDGPFQ